MRSALIVALVAVPVIGLAVLLVGRHPQAQAQHPEAAAKWEYKVVTFSGTDEKMAKQLNDLADEGWEYVGLVAAPYWVPAGTVVGRGEVSRSGSVALRRPKK
jgi:hypothetical protein